MTGAFSTNSDLARLNSLGLWKMDGKQTLLYTSADPRRVDAGIQIENAPVLAHFPLAIDRSSEVVLRDGSVATKDELAVLNGYGFIAQEGDKTCAGRRLSDADLFEYRRPRGGFRRLFGQR